MVFDGDVSGDSISPPVYIAYFLDANLACIKIKGCKVHEEARETRLRKWKWRIESVFLRFMVLEIDELASSSYFDRLIYN